MTNGRLFIRWVAWVLIVCMTVGPGLALAQEAAAGGSGRKFLSIDYKEFPTFGAAVRNSAAPTDLHANVGAAVKNTLDPLNPGRYVASVLIFEAQKQLASGEGLDLGKLVRNISVPSMALGYVGAQTGDIAGAALQTIMSNTLGLAGGLVGGLAVRPILWFVGNQMGQSLGRGLQSGDASPSKAFAGTLTAFNPVEDASQMIGDAVFSVIGQALIPIPLVGAMVGGAVGGTLGLLLGKAFVASKAGQSFDQALRNKLGNLANSISPGSAGQPQKTAAGNPAAPVSSAPAVAVPAVFGAPAAPLVVPPRPLDAQGRVAYQELLDAMKSGDRARIEAAYSKLQSAR